jgi:hypothetical protein
MSLHPSTPVRPRAASLRQVVASWLRIWPWRQRSATVGYR